MTDTPRFRSDVTVELVRHSASDTDVLWAARVSTAGEKSLAEIGKDPERSKGLINYLMRDRHGSPFEHNSMTFFISAPIFAFREFHRHRVGWCVAGDTDVTLETERGDLRRTKIADLCQQWHQRSLPSVHRHGVRCYDETTMLAARTRITDVYRSGVKPLLRLVTAAGKGLRCSGDHAILTPDGWRKADELTVGDAVMSGSGGGGEQCRAKPDPLVSVAADGEDMTYDLAVAGPWHNFLANGIVVHNSYNEESGRYRELRPVFYLPGQDRKLVQRGRPGKYEFAAGTAEQHAVVSKALEDSYRHSYAAYQELLTAGIAREVARAVLPVGLFSSMYATCNARSLMHFLGLRTRHEQAKVPSFPQREIEMIGERMEEEWARLMPLTHAAFNANGRVAP